MEFLIVFSVTVGVVLALRNPVKKVPIAFYAMAALIVIAYFAGASGLLGSAWWKPLILLVKRCMVALSLFTVVMFIGVLPKGSRLDAWLRPIRAELSIVACILCLGHMCTYLMPYAARALSGSLSINIMVSFATAVMLFALLGVLGVTSFNFVKHRMSGRAWKNIQRLAYPFFLLVYVHLLFMLAPAATQGGEQAIFSVIMYSALFFAYGVLRLFRVYKDKQSGGAKSSC